MNDIEELKARAKELGYTMAKKPCYQCSCYCPYPNENYRKKNGKWKCLDKYEPIKSHRIGEHYPMTKCRRKAL